MFLSGNPGAVDLVYGLNFNSISPSVPEIRSLNRKTGKQTDGQQSDLIRVPLFLKKYRALKIKHVTTLIKLLSWIKLFHFVLNVKDKLKS